MYKLLKNCISVDSNTPEDPKKSMDRTSMNIYKQFNRTYKILILGGEDSGKTTIVNQMKIIHGDGFNNSERDIVKNEIRQNCHEAICSLIQTLLDSGIKVDLKSHEHLSTFLEIRRPLSNIIEESYMFQIQKIWNDPDIQKIYRERNESNFFDNVKLFMKKANEIFDPNYVPSDQDILHNRKRCQHFEEYSFNIDIAQPFRIFDNFSQTFHLFDIGKQILDTKNTKWLQVFDGIQIMLFIISVNNFNKNVSNEKNLLKDDIEKFSSITNSPYMNVTGIIVFLNKIDLLEEKMENGIHFGDKYSDYKNYTLDMKSESFDVDESSIYLEIKRAKNYIVDMLTAAENHTINCKEKGENDIKKRKFSHGFYYPNMIRKDCRNSYYHFTVASNQLKTPSMVQLVRHVITTAHLTDFHML